MSLVLTDTGLRERVSCRADLGSLIVLGVFSAFFLGLGIAVWMKPPHHDATFLLVVIGILAIPWAGALSVRFSFDPTEIHYQSLFTRLRVRTADIVGLSIVAERSEFAPQGVARFYLILRAGPQRKLNVKPLPLKVVRELCAALRQRGVTVTVQDTSAARRMAAQLLINQP